VSARPLIVIDQVQHNPGESLTPTQYMDPTVLAALGGDAQVITNYRFVQCMLKYDDLDPRICPSNSELDQWIDQYAPLLDQYIKPANSANVELIYHTDALMFPKTLIDIYREDICDTNGRVSLNKAKTWDLLEYQIDAVFRRFPGLTGLMI